jgi:hypothetical protein
MIRMICFYIIGFAGNENPFEDIMLQDIGNIF